MNECCELLDSLHQAPGHCPDPIWVSQGSLMAENKEAGGGEEAREGQGCVGQEGAPKTQEMGGLDLCPSTSCLLSFPECCRDCPPVTVTVKKAESSPASHTNSPPSSGWAAGSTKRRRGPSLSSTRASLSSTSSPSLYQRTGASSLDSSHISTTHSKLTAIKVTSSRGCMMRTGGSAEWGQPRLSQTPCSHLAA